MILVIDNYDSFTYNLVHYLNELGAETRVVRNDAIGAAEAIGAAARGGRALARPLHAERGRHLPRADRGPRREDLPILGVCLGHQAIGQALGGEVVRAKTLMHGKTSAIHHTGGGILRGPARPLHRHALPQPRGRPRNACPSELDVTAWTDDGEIMGISASRRRRCSACSSTRRSSPPKAATRCWPTSWTSPASSAGPRPERPEAMSDAFKPLLGAPGGRRDARPKPTPTPSSPPACGASRRRRRSPRRSPPCGCAARPWARSPPARAPCAAQARDARAPLRGDRRLRHRRRRRSHLQHLDRRRALSLAGAGVKVAKHGNRAMSPALRQRRRADRARASTSPPTVGQQRRALDEAGVCFLFAPAHHAAMRHVLPIRQELGFRTIFNLLGPLSNPAGAQPAAVGVSDAALGRAAGAGAGRAGSRARVGRARRWPGRDHHHRRDRGRRVARRRRAALQRHARGRRPAARAARGPGGRRPGRQRARRCARMLGGPDRALSRHRAAERRRRIAGRGEGRDLARGRRRWPPRSIDDGRAARGARPAGRRSTTTP